MDKIIIPFGEECYTCQSIDSKFSETTCRKMAFPFDYVGHTYIEKIYDNMFDLFNSPNFYINLNDFEKRKFEENYYFVHKKYEFKYWHDVNFKHDDFQIDECNDFQIDQCNDFIEKYNRRYERLKNFIQNDNVYIYSVNHFDNIYTKIIKQEQVYKLFDLLHKHNNNIKFIAVNYGEELYNINNLQFINLPVNYDLPFVESKQDFTKKLYDFTKSFI